MSRYFTKDRSLPFVSGVLMSLNFAAFWAVPIMGMGQLHKAVLKPLLQPAYLFLEGNTYLRKFAETYVYRDPRHADFFALSLLLVINCSITIPFVFYWQLTRGTLPAWLIFAYYCSWVGIGGSMMGAAYGLAHKEGHSRRMYKDSLHGVIGNLFENGLGVFFGNIPWNFTTSHIMIHHKVNGGVGDTFYLWDFDRSNVGEFMLYVNRILMHMVGYSSVKYFRAQDMNDRADLLLQGIKTYVAIAFAILAITRSFSFVFWIYLEPLLCMTYFLALINIGFHGFLEYDDNGGHVPVVDSTTIIEGEDDLFGEDDHMAHHYNAGVYFRDLPAHQKTKETEFKHRHASVFRKLSIVELSIFILFGLWEQLADHYVDYTGKMTRDEIIQMLKMRAKRVETTYEKYQEYLINPTEKSRDNLRMEVHNDRKTVIAESKKSG